MAYGRTAALIILFVGLIVCLFGCWKFHGFFTDDTYISLRYCHNLIEGNGLVWNPGERVEGYSNFLYILLISLLGRLGIDLVFASKAVGVLSFALLLGYLIRRSNRLAIGKHGRFASPLLPILLTGGSFCMVIWSFGGLETTLFSMLVTIGVLTAWDGLTGEPRTAMIAGTVLGLATLTRPDGGLFVVIAGCFYLVPLIRRQPKSGPRLVALLVPFLLITGAHEIWRYVYYGRLLPNTWYVKGVVSWARLDMGWRYLLGFAITQPFLLPVGVAALIYRTIVRKWNTELAFLAVSVVAFIGYVMAIGGDHMLGYRPLIAVIPLMAVLIARSLEPILFGVRAVIATSVIVLLIISQIAFPGRGIQGAEIPDGAAFCGRIVGEYINSNWSRRSLVALNSAGATPYYAPDLRFLDMLGLNDTAIARRDPTPMLLPYQIVPGHAKGDGQYVFDRKPDYIIAGPSNGSDIYHARTLSEYELSRIHDFKSLYRLKSVRLPALKYAEYEQYLETKSGQMVFTYYERVR